MRYRIIHRLTYEYEQPVRLSPHLLRMRPRCHGDQQLHHHDLHIQPEPLGLTHLLDAEGNGVTQCWWPDPPTPILDITVTSEVSTYCTNPFNFLLEPWATQLPLDYPTSLRASLQPYLLNLPLQSPEQDNVATQLAQAIAEAVDGNTVNFLTELNQRIHSHCQYEARETGDPWPPWMTWTRKRGTCRDFVVLFMAACRSIGLAARFVSGYEEGDPAHQSDLHAWAEVYLPGAGWRGYDPTLGLVVSDHHVAVCASHWQRNTGPVSGHHEGEGSVNATMKAEVQLRSVR